MGSGAHGCLEKDRAREGELLRTVNHAIEKAERRRGAGHERVTGSKLTALSIHPNILAGLTGRKGRPAICQLGALVIREASASRILLANSMINAIND
jgi:hypothetical protein